MRIVLVHNFYQQSGGEDVVFEQELQMLRRAGHEVATYCRTNTEIEQYAPAQRLRLARETVWSHDTIEGFGRLLARRQPDIVHVHNTFPLISPSIYWACHNAGIPVVQTLHNFRLLCPQGSLLRNKQPCERCIGGSLLQSVIYGCYRQSRSATAVLASMLTLHRAMRTWVRMVDLYIALSEFARMKFQQGGLPVERLVVKPNFVHPDPGKGDGAGNYAMFLGRLSEEKGVETLIETWKCLRTPVPLHIVGDGPLREKLASTLGSDPRVRIYGALPRQQAMAVLRAACFVVVPSLCHENFPLGVAEAFACGVPVISSEGGSLQELVVEGETGFLFPRGNAEALAAKVGWAWHQRASLEQVRQRCRSVFETKYTATANYKLLRTIYARVIAAHRSASTPAQAA